jgi:hypothetical protein
MLDPSLVRRSVQVAITAGSRQLDAAGAYSWAARAKAAVLDISTA